MIGPMARHSAGQVPARRGLSLLEVLIALSILAVGLGAIGQLVDAGTRAASRHEIEALARVHGNRQLGLVLSGLERAEGSGWQPLPTDPRWDWRCVREPGPRPGLDEVVISVRDPESGSVTTVYQLVRTPPTPGGSR